MKLIVLRGTSCSGKSTFIDKLINNAIIAPEWVVSSDHYRKVLNDNCNNQKVNREVFDLMRTIVENRMKNRCPITIVDATNLKWKDFRGFYDIGMNYFADVYVLDFSPPDIEILKERNNRRMKYEDNVPLIPEYVIDTMVEKYHHFKPVFQEKLGHNFIEVDITDIEKYHDLFDCYDGNLFYEEDYPDGMWFIGDVHACHDELDELCTLIREQSDAPIWCMGDIIDRGPSLEKLIDVYKKHNLNSIIGNHDYNFILEMNGKECRSKSRKVTHKQYENLSEVDKEVFHNILRKMKNLVIFIPEIEKDIIVTHSGIDGMFIEYDQLPSVSDCIGYNGELVETEYSQIHGHRHWEYSDVDFGKNDNYNIDGGCVYGYKLVAYNPITKQKLEVKAKKKYVI